MKNCIRVNPKAYTIDGKGQRFCPTPFLHYPDLCPHWTEKGVEGDCYERCDELPCEERPCCQAAIPPDEAAPDQAAPAAEGPKRDCRVCDVEHLRDYPECFEECGKDECDGVPVGPEPEPKQEGPFIPEGYYWCGKCQHPHNPESKIGQSHLEFQADPPVLTPESEGPPKAIERQETTASLASLINQFRSQVFERLDQISEQIESLKDTE